MFLTSQRDRTFQQYLLENDVFTLQSFAAWEQPDEGDMLSVLITNSRRYEPRVYINAGLKCDPAFMRVNNLEPDWNYVRGYPVVAIYRMIEDFGAYPMKHLGKFYWFSLTLFHPFSKQEAAAAFNIPVELCVWNIITPTEHADLATKFSQQISRFGR